ncbi:squalene/phytoene synthase family protein [Caenispirillum bisanense]|uniref:squalene/phytoene synthase family protein n=1 Tax=Caenispirillum bisanense TaxID=414052 RepID=UPI0031D6DA2C
MPVTDTASPAWTPPTSGKGMADENFPVAGLLLAARHRPVVAAYYRFARTADDIADDPALPTDRKLALLDRLEAVLSGEAPAAAAPPAAALRPLLLDRGVPLTVAADLLVAFRADARNTPCETWDELMAYCRHSAAPVGRFLLRLHGAPAAADSPADALCAALQVLNHLQDLRADWTRLGRRYLPLEDMAEPADLGRTPAPERLRAPILAALERTRDLLAAAAPLPVLAGDRRLAMQSAMVLHLAHRLAARLTAAAPHTEGVRAARHHWLTAALAGLAAGAGVRP